jgi:N-acetylmuramoyl-L-alanine amidase
VIRAFQAVYGADPAFPKAPAAVAAVGRLYWEMGQQFSQDADYEASIKAHEFLATQYPHSSLARDALFAIGEIYEKDLQRPDDARKAYQRFLEQYPKAAKAIEAQKALNRIDGAEDRRAAAEAASSRPVREVPGQGKLLLVNDIRRWVGSDYTRIVIGVEDEVQFNAQRVANPDRLVFDLSNTRLNPSLLGKTFPVQDAFLRRIRMGQYKPTVTRVVLEVEQIDDYSVFSLPNPSRLVIDIHGRPRALATTTSNPAWTRTGTATGVTSAIASGRPNSNIPEAESENRAGQRPRPLAAPSSNRLNSGSNGPERAGSTGAAPAVVETVDTAPNLPPVVIEGKARHTTGSPSETTTSPTATLAVGSSVTHRTASNPLRLPESPAGPSNPTESGSRTLTRALGLKIGRIVIDPGHGGHDTGTIGPGGLCEKDLVLDVALRLKKVIETKMASEVVMTRSDDTFIPLEERTALANQKDADLFISIHANASRDPSARGVETYYLNFTSNPEALEVAARENATSQESVHRLQDLIQKIALSEKIEESRELARQAQRSVYGQIARSSGQEHDRGLKKAPFVVLIGAKMPSILSEISFLTNPRDESLLKRASYRQKIAEALYRGIARYVKNLGGITVAQQAEPGASELPSPARRSKSSPAALSSPAGSANF